MPGTSSRPFLRLRILLLIASALWLVAAAPAAVAVVRPLDGVGNFHTSVEVINRWDDEDRLDVLVFVEVANQDLAFKEEARGMVARLRIEVVLESLDGRVINEKRPVRTAHLSRGDAGSTTLFQTFGIVLKDVPFRSGSIRCEVFDVNARKAGLVNEMRKQSRVSSSAGGWAATNGPRAAGGVAVGEPLFLAHAPLADWRPGSGLDENAGWLYDYTHASRRYGLEQDRLQLYVPVWPPAGGVPLADEPVGLRVQVTNSDLDFVLDDTVLFDDRGRSTLAAGRPAALLYELDVNLLPEGSFLLSLGPLDGQGRGAVVEFDVIWRLSALARRPGEVLGEGRTVFHGRQLAAFEAASSAEREAMLKEYWHSVDPAPEEPVNAAYLEFLYRKAFVREFLGGFDITGAVDPRGEVFMALGMPDDVRAEAMPPSFNDQDDARIKVFERFAPDREGTMVRGNSGSNDTSPYSENDAIPMPWSHRAEKQRQVAEQSAAHLFAFELWEYERGGKPLWESEYSSLGMGQRFLFVDRTGNGDFFLESSNLIQGEN